MSAKERIEIITEIVEELQECSVDTYAEKKLCLKAVAAHSKNLTFFLNKVFEFVEARQPKLLVMK